MAGNEDVIETLKLDLKIGVTGQKKLERAVENLGRLSSVLTQLNPKLEQYARLTSQVSTFKTPRISGASASGTTQGGGTNTAETKMETYAASAQKATSSISGASDRKSVV